MKDRNRFGLILVLTVALLGALVRPAEPQEEQVPAPQAVYVSEPLLAGILTAFNIPSRVLLCGADAVMGFIVVGASGGRRYAQAANIMEEGCAGPWVITPQMIRKGRPTSQDSSRAQMAGYGQP